MTLFKVDGLIGRSMQKMAAAPWFRKVGPKIVPPLDRALHQLTGGRVILSQALVPSMVLTTTGAKTGLPRESPLACVPDDDGGWWVVGSNFGQQSHPAWTGNLIAEPKAMISYGGRSTEAVAKLLSDEEKADVWPRLIAVWPAYDEYVKASDKNIRVFHLAPV